MIVPRTLSLGGGSIDVPSRCPPPKRAPLQDRRPARSEPDHAVLTAVDWPSSFMRTGLPAPSSWACWRASPNCEGWTPISFSRRFRVAGNFLQNYAFAMLTGVAVSRCLSCGRHRPCACSTSTGTRFIRRAGLTASSNATDQSLKPPPRMSSRPRTKRGGKDLIHDSPRDRGE
jgi:hypothetical protein